MTSSSENDEVAEALDDIKNSSNRNEAVNSIDDLFQNHQSDIIEILQRLMLH